MYYEYLCSPGSRVWVEGWCARVLGAWAQRASASAGGAWATGDQSVGRATAVLYATGSLCSARARLSGITFTISVDCRRQGCQSCLDQRPHAELYLFLDHHYQQHGLLDQQLVGVDGHSLQMGIQPRIWLCGTYSYTLNSYIVILTNTSIVHFYTAYSYTSTRTNYYYWTSW